MTNQMMGGIAKGGTDSKNTAAGILGTSKSSGHMVLEVQAHCNMESRQSMSDCKKALVLGAGASHYSRQKEAGLRSISKFSRH